MPMRRGSLFFALDVVRAVCMRATVILVASFPFAAQVGALPLCEGKAGVQCREDVEAGINDAIDSLRAGVPNLDDQQSGISDFLVALDNIDAARDAIINIELTDQNRCRAASNADKLALNSTAGGILRASAIPEDQFSSSETFTATHTALAALVQSMIDAVGNNLDEIELIGKDFMPEHVAEARKQLEQASSDLAQDDLVGAADKARSAFDLVDGDGNVPPSCLVEVPAHCPALPEATIFPGDTLFNNTVRSQMWITDGIWWGAFSDASSGIYFYKKVEDHFVKGDLIDDNFLAGKPDTIWNGKELFILIYQNALLATLYKYTYASNAQTYSLVGGFPIGLPLSGGVSDIAFDQDSTGKLWATYTDALDRGVHVIWSTSADHTMWDVIGAILASDLADFTAEAATIVRFGGNKIGVVWDNQVVGEIGFRFHLDEEAEVDWSPQETVDCCEGIPGVADDHLSLRAAPDGRLFLIAKDAFENGRLHLYIRSADGVWGQKTNVNPNPDAAPTRPVLVLDVENKDAYVLHRNSNTYGLIFFARTSMESPDFSSPCVFINTQANNVTSTKQPVDATTDLVAAASGDDLIFSNVIALGHAPEPSPSPEPKLWTEKLQAHRVPQLSRRQLSQGAPVANYGFIWNNRLSHSATPNAAEQWEWLRAQGVNTIVYLDRKRSDYGKFGFENFLWIPFDNGTPFTDIDAERFLRFVQDADNQPVHILSAEANDHIATMAALISYAIDGQTLEAALAGARVHNAGQELSSTQVEWLHRWAMQHPSRSHRRR